MDFDEWEKELQQEEIEKLKLEMKALHDYWQDSNMAEDEYFQTQAEYIANIIRIERDIFVELTDMDDDDIEVIELEPGEHPELLELLEGMMANETSTNEPTDWDDAWAKFNEESE